MQGVDRGLAKAAKDRGLEYRVALAKNDPARMIAQVQSFLASKVGAVVAAPVDPATISRKPPAGHLVRRVCRHDRSASRDFAVERPAIPHGQSAG